MTDRLQILVGDCRETLRTLGDESVEMVLTSPPYDRLRSYGGYEWNFDAVAAQIFRVLIAGGVLCWNVGDSVVNGGETLTSFRQAIAFVDRHGFQMHDTMIYEKLNPGNPSDNHRRYNQVIEYIFVLSKGPPKTWNPIRDKRNSSFGTMRYGKKTRRDPNGKHDGFFSDRKPAAEFGLRGNCWRGRTAAQETVCAAREHPAVMPQWLARDLILSWSNPGETILDPMAGSGTSGRAAVELGRKAILCELNPAYAELCRQRCDITPGFAL